MVWKTKGVDTNLARKKGQIKAKANVKMINNFYHTSEYQLSKDKKYLEIIPGGG